jgi:hypothetical protein
MEASPFCAGKSVGISARTELDADILAAIRDVNLDLVIGKAKPTQGKPIPCRLGLNVCPMALK